MTNRKAPESVLVALAEAAAEYWQGMKHAVNEPRRNHLLDCLAAYRAATAPLRTRASVDAEIAGEVRESVESGIRSEDCLCPEGGGDNARAERIRRLCSESTADEPSPLDALFGAAPDLPLDDPEPCGCEEGEALKREVKRLLTLTESSTAPNTLEWRNMVDELRQEAYDLKHQITLVRAQAQGGIGGGTRPHCPGEAACREILLITSP